MNLIKVKWRRRWTALLILAIVAGIIRVSNAIFKIFHKNVIYPSIVSVIIIILTISDILYCYYKLKQVEE